MEGRIVLDHLAYVIYEHPDLEKFMEFAHDFGFELAGEVDGSMYMNGYGIDHYSYIATQAPTGNPKRFIGAGFVAKTEDDFVLACQSEGAKVRNVERLPGGGEVAIFKDPNGYEMHVIWGQGSKNIPSRPVSACIDGIAPMNGAIEKKRKGQFVRLASGPAKIHKLGHFGYTTDNYETTCTWYADRFNFTPTDILYAPEDASVDVATFFRLDLGKQYVDHHCFLIARGESPGTKPHHSSFEVEDLDTQFMGHKWLEGRGYRLIWGIGRHFHGSQVFDYWFDTSGFIVEHYADGDMVNDEAQTSRAAAGNMAVWGPPVPAIWGGSQTSS